VDHVDSICRIDEWAKKETSVKVGGKESHSSTLKMEAKFSPETSVYFQQTAQHYTPEGRILQANALIEFIIN
jgi:hypothetical protein